MAPSAHSEAVEQMDTQRSSFGVERTASTTTTNNNNNNMMMQRAAGPAAVSMPVHVVQKSRVGATSGYTLSASLPGSPLPKQSNDGIWIAGASPEQRLGLKHMRAYEDSAAASKVRAFIYELDD